MTEGGGKESNNSNRDIFIKIPRERFYSVYTDFFRGYFGITRKEAKVLVEIMKLGKLIDTQDIKKQLISNVPLRGRKELAQYVHKLRKKKLLTKSRYVIETDPRVYKDPSDFSVTINFKVTS